MSQATRAMKNQVQPIFIGVVGDQGVGKTSFISTRFQKQKFMREGPSLDAKNKKYTFRTVVGHNNGENSAIFLEANKQEPFEQLEATLSEGNAGADEPQRKLHYERMDACIICYDLLDEASYESVKTKWYPEIKRYNPSATVLLVGMKCDLAHIIDNIDMPNPLKAKNLVDELGRATFKGKYAECSSKSDLGDNGNSRKMIRMALKNNPTYTNNCAIKARAEAFASVSFKERSQKSRPRLGEGKPDYTESMKGGDEDDEPRSKSRKMRSNSADYDNLEAFENREEVNEGKKKPFKYTKLGMKLRKR